MIETTVMKEIIEKWKIVLDSKGYGDAVLMNFSKAKSF